MLTIVCWLNILRLVAGERLPMLYTRVWFKMTDFNNVLKLNDDDTVTYLELDPKTGEEATKELTDVPDELMEQLRLGATVTLSQYHTFGSERVDREYMKDADAEPEPKDVNKVVVHQDEETIG